jgi:hypothetical protein
MNLDQIVSSARRKNVLAAYRKKEDALKDTRDRWEKIAAGRNELSLTPQKSNSDTALIVESSRLVALLLRKILMFFSHQPDRLTATDMKRTETHQLCLNWVIE